MSRLSPVMSPVFRALLYVYIAGAVASVVLTLFGFTDWSAARAAAPIWVPALLFLCVMLVADAMLDSRDAMRTLRRFWHRVRRFG